MGSTIDFKGIRTNNLKGGDLSLEEHCFIGITGPSGSGKTSLAYGTVYAISLDEWSRISNQPLGAYQNYRVDSYHNIKPTVALKQDNRNVNPRSILATFLHLDRYIRLLYSIVSGLSPSRFSINNPSNTCSTCLGLGSVSVLDEQLLIDWDKSIEDRPFLLLKKAQELAVLDKFAESNKISRSIPLEKLSKQQQNILLYGKSKEKFSVRYKQNGKYRVHSFHYIGYLDLLASLQADITHISSFKKVAHVQKQEVCSACGGTRFSDYVASFKYRSHSIGELYAMELSNLSTFLIDSLERETSPQLCKLLADIKLVVDKLIDSNLGYLTLNRSIPTLSGGELQRVQLVGITISNLSDVLYIVDEPSSSLHVLEYDAILADLKELRDKGNTILMVEHNPYFLSQTDRNIMIGPSSGSRGGQIMDYTGPTKVEALFELKVCSEFTEYSNMTANNLKDISVHIPKACFTGIYGISGSGKTTLSKCIRQLDPRVEYISQNVLRGSKTSSVGSYSGILSELRNLYSKNNNLDYSLSITDPACQCPKCSGRGVLRYTLDFSSTIIEVVCEDCLGQRYNEEVLALMYGGQTFADVLSMPIDDLIGQSLFGEHKKISELLCKLSDLGLGHLSLSRTTDTLSGGESQRLKAIKAISKKLKGKTFIFDEPLKGLGVSDAIKILVLFKKMTTKGATIIMVEHSVIGLQAVDYVIEMGPGKGRLGGQVLFEGEIELFRESSHWKKYQKMGAV